MFGERVGRTTRKIRVAAPAGVVYALMADASKWPLYFSLNVHVERLEFDGERDRLRMWCLMDGRLKSWTACRRLDPVERRVEFRHELPGASPRTPGCVLSVRERGPRDTELALRYDFSVTDPPDDVTERERVVDRFSSIHLADLKRFAEQWTRLDELVLSFEDSIHIKGPAELAYDLLYRAGDWPELVPHVTRVGLTEESPGVQRMSLERLTGNGSHTTESVRICFPHAGRIVHKQTADLLLAAHTGEWLVAPDETGTTITSKQSVVLREEDITEVLGPGAGLADARLHVRTTLGRDSQALLALAKQHAESAVRML